VVLAAFLVFIWNAGLLTTPITSVENL